MEFLIIWIGSIILSFLLNMYFGIRIFKDIADWGYLINLNKINKVGDDLDLNTSLNLNSLKYQMLIPVYNIANAFYRANQYNVYKSDHLEYFYFSDCVIKMSEEENKKYSSSQNGMTALMLSLKYYDKYKKLFSEKENETSNIVEEEPKQTDDDIKLSNKNIDEFKNNFDNSHIDQNICSDKGPTLTKRKRPR